MLTKRANADAGAPSMARRPSDVATPQEAGASCRTLARSDGRLLRSSRTRTRGFGWRGPPKAGVSGLFR